MAGGSLGQREGPEADYASRDMGGCSALRPFVVAANAGRGIGLAPDHGADSYTLSKRGGFTHREVARIVRMSLAETVCFSLSESSRVLSTWKHSGCVGWMVHWLACNARNREDQAIDRRIARTQGFESVGAWEFTDRRTDPTKTKYIS